jgi:hypothetical protein
MHTTFMKLRLAALVLCATFGAASFAATTQEEAAMAFTQAICDAIKDGDLGMLESALAPEFTLVGSDSSVQDRRETLQEVRAREPR